MGTDVVRILASLVPTIGAAIQLTQSVAKRLRAVAAARAKTGSLGGFFEIICYYPVVIVNLLLGAIVILSLVSLAVGVTKLVDQPLFARMAANHSLIAKADLLFNYSPILALFYFVVAVIVHYDLPSKMSLYCIRTLSLASPLIRYTPGYISARNFIRQGEDAPTLINVDIDRCKVLANYIIGLVASPPPGFNLNIDRAKLPAGLSHAERANVLLIGNVIEGCIHDLPTSHAAKAIKFGAFYAQLGQVGLGEERPFSPESIRLHATQSAFFGKLKAAMPAGMLPDEASVRTAVKDAVALLAKRYWGNGAKLGHTMFGASGDTAMARVRRFPQMSAKPNPMDVQFVKLAVEAGVWPKVTAGMFLYPFSRNVAAFLFNTGCLLTGGDTDEVPLDESVKRLVAYAEEVIVNEFLHLVRSDNSDAVSGFVAAEFGTSRSEIPKWAAARVVDYCVWQLAKRPQGWTLQPTSVEGAAEPESGWRLDANFLRRS